MSDLERCPFCGAGTFEIRPNGRMWLGMKYSEPASVSVLHWCEATPGQPSRVIERVGRDEASAIEAWNRRAQPAQAGPVLTDADWPDVDDMAHSAVQEALAFGLGHDVFYRYGHAVLAKAQIAAEQAVLAKRVPMKREEVKELARKVGYDNATAQERADFINGIRHAEVWHGIVGEKGGA